MGEGAMTEQPELSFEETFAAARAYAMRSLGRRESAESELLMRLRKRGYDETVSQAVLDYCRDHQWVSDERYGAMAVRAGAAKGHGPTKIRFDLRRKGLSDTELELAFDQPELDWFELALALLQRRTDAAVLKEFKVRMKWLKYLLGRGFNQDQARYALDTLLAESEADDD
ncbi:recombination regulator RecX [Aeromonas rivuli]|nr:MULTISPECIES: regulatory protein RecX [Aeromonas]UBO75896.1 recombination regulator RecX [Aeromonas rivuli]